MFVCKFSIVHLTDMQAECSGPATLFAMWPSEVALGTASEIVEQFSHCC